VPPDHGLRLDRTTEALERVDEGLRERAGRGGVDVAALLRAEQRGQHPLALDPEAADPVLRHGEAVPAGAAPERPVEDRHGLRGQRLALAVKRAQARVGEARDADAAQRAHRQGADDRVRVQDLSADERDGARRAHVDRGDRGAVADAARELGLEGVDERARAARDLEVLPLVVVVEEDAADARRTAGAGEDGGALDGAFGGREGPGLAEAVGAPRGVERAQERADGEAVEACRVGMRPRIGGVDDGGDSQDLLVEAAEDREILLRQPALAEVRALEHVVPDLTRLVGEAGDQFQPELGRELPVGVVDAAGELAAKLQDPAVAERHALDAATGAREVAGAAEPAEPTSDDDHVRAHGRSFACTLRP
jgi:hypothetical protein